MSFVRFSQKPRQVSSLAGDNPSDAFPTVAGSCKSLTTDRSYDLLKLWRAIVGVKPHLGGEPGVCWPVFDGGRGGVETGRQGDCAADAVGEEDALAVLGALHSTGPFIWRRPFGQRHVEVRQTERAADAVGEEDALAVLRTLHLDGATLAQEKSA